MEFSNSIKGWGIFTVGLIALIGVTGGVFGGTPAQVIVALGLVIYLASKAGGVSYHPDILAFVIAGPILAAVSTAANLSAAGGETVLAGLIGGTAAALITHNVVNKQKPEPLIAEMVVSIGLLIILSVVLALPGAPIPAAWQLVVVLLATFAGLGLYRQMTNTSNATASTASAAALAR